MDKRFDEWNKIKKELITKDKNLVFKTREIFWVKVGQNVGYETDGKGIEFLRPVLILRKFSKDSFLGIPLTTSHKEDMFHYKFMLNTNSKINYAVLSQVKLFDARRIYVKLGKISVDDFEKLKVKLKELIFE
ncbi:type II toxin-antitoxin system PemK/MazF family toxin [Sulfurimonas sp.]|uniref:type II toxin-antitoxin system PemK/MazF family toxin n=1 Tax=Sulfurimonas sp. TaxID=2022749 RepID=UPI002AB2D5B3|nr:type II toxin-antitoxin system PemK/MazF family toxin [Sulfurimonas sp.]